MRPASVAEGVRGVRAVERDRVLTVRLSLCPASLPPRRPCTKRCSLLYFIHHLIVVGPRGRRLGGVVQYPLGSDQHRHTSNECDIRAIRAPMDNGATCIDLEISYFKNGEKFVQKKKETLNAFYLIYHLQLLIL